MPCCPTRLELPAAGIAHSGHLGAPSAFTIVAPAATARNNCREESRSRSPRHANHSESGGHSGQRSLGFDLSYNYLVVTAIFLPAMLHRHDFMNVRECAFGSSGHPQPAGKTLPQLVARMSEARCGSVMLRLAPAPDIAPLIRATFGNTSQPSFPAKAGNPVRRGLSAQLRPLEYWVTRPGAQLRTRRVTTWRSIRSPILTIFWHCGRPQISSRTGPERRPGNEPSMVLAEDLGVQRVWQC